MIEFLIAFLLIWGLCIYGIYLVSNSPKISNNNFEEIPSFSPVRRFKHKNTGKIWAIVYPVQVGVSEKIRNASIDDFVFYKNGEMKLK